MRSFSTASFMLLIWDLSWEPSFVVIETAITGRDTPEARPRAAFDATKT
jgi:hypothetical protein